MGGTFSNIVWSTSPEIAQELKLMPSVDFVVEANRALLEDYGSQPYSGLAELLSSGLGKQLFGSELGTQLLGAFTPSSAEQFQVPPRVMDCVTERLSFPLSLLHATKYVNHRVALVGDAAHTVHPLAGQGVNLGFGDALALVNTLHRGVEGGFDIGEVSSRVLIVFVCLRIMGLKKIPYLPIFSVSKSPGLCPWALLLSRKEY
jgi:ubiquinone biosynthesis monooxygenase Coq6